MAEGETVFTFKANTKPAEEQTDSFFNSLQGKFTEINSGLELINKAVTAIAKASQAVVDFAKAGEEIQAIGTRFELIAKQAGLIPENIASGIENAVAGTVDMEDALKAASGAIVSLEAGANRLPEIFNLAKKATALFGGDVVERFEQINMAIASGSTRALRGIGIILDTDKVYKDYANSLDITADKLTLAERQQALMNAVLDKGATAFKNINSSITPISENLKKTDVAIKELGDTGATVFNQLFGATISNSLSKFALSLQALNIQLGEALLGKVPTAAENLKLLNNQLFELESRRDMAAARGNIGQLEQIYAEIEATKQQILENQSLVNQEATRTAGLNNLADAAAKATEAQKRLLEEGLIPIGEELKGRMKSALDIGMQKLNDMEDQAKILGTTFKNALVNVIARGVDHIAQKIVKGEDVFGGLLSVVLMTFGEMAQSIGTTMIGIGIAIESLKALKGFAAVAAGIGLVLIGGIMKALAGGGGGPVVNPNEAAADAVIASGDVYQQTQEEERAAAQTGVQVVVQGNIFDSRETGLQIAQIINDSFDLNGTIIRANA